MYVFLNIQSVVTYFRQTGRVKGVRKASTSVSRNASIRKQIVFRGKRKCASRATGAIRFCAANVRASLLVVKKFLG